MPGSDFGSSMVKFGVHWLDTSKHSPYTKPARPKPQAKARRKGARESRRRNRAA